MNQNQVPPYDDFDFDSFYEQQEREYAEWKAWWEALSDEDRAREEDLMAAHAADEEARRAAGEEMF